MSPLRELGERLTWGRLLAVRRAASGRQIVFPGFALLICALFSGLAPVPIFEMITEAFTTNCGFAFLTLDDSVGVVFAISPVLLFLAARTS